MDEDEHRRNPDESSLSLQEKEARRLQKRTRERTDEADYDLGGNARF